VKTSKKRPRASKKAGKRPEAPSMIEVSPGFKIPDPHSSEFREGFPWTAGEICDSYTSIEAMLFSWFEKEGIDPARGAVMDLAVRVSTCIEPFRSFFRASQGWDGYDLKECLRKAKLAEEKL
jgi:hypothetical protein